MSNFNTGEALEEKMRHLPTCRGVLYKLRITFLYMNKFDCSVFDCVHVARNVTHVDSIVAGLAPTVFPCERFTNF